MEIYGHLPYLLQCLLVKAEKGIEKEVDHSPKLELGHSHENRRPSSAV